MRANILDSIATTQSDDPSNCLREMLAEWLRGQGEPPRTWSTIVAALKRVNGLEALAEDIERKFNLISKESKATTKVTALQGNIIIIYVPTYMSMLCKCTGRWGSTPCSLPASQLSKPLFFCMHVNLKILVGKHHSDINFTMDLQTSVLHTFGENVCANVGGMLYATLRLPLLQECI